MNIRALFNEGSIVLLYNSGIKIINFFLSFSKNNFFSYFFLFFVLKFANLSIDVTINFLVWSVCICVKTVPSNLIKIFLFLYHKYFFNFFLNIKYFLILFYKSLYKILYNMFTYLYNLFDKVISFLKTFFYFFPFLIKRNAKNRPNHGLSELNFDEKIINLDNEQPIEHLKVLGKKRTYHLLEGFSTQQQMEERMIKPIDGFIYLHR
jgi:hypothetical protein